MPDDLLFEVQEVVVRVPEYDLPGPPRIHAICEHCGQKVRDGKERVIGGKSLCRPCAGDAYFYPLCDHANQKECVRV